MEDWKLKASVFAFSKHKGQLDDSGISYFNAHILQVVRILKQITNDSDIISAGYLHDTLEDTDTIYDELKQEFNKRIADLVLELTHERKPDNKGYYFPRLKSRDAVLVKFADRLSNLSRMKPWDKKRQQRYIKKSNFWKSY